MKKDVKFDHLIFWLGALMFCIGVWAIILAFASGAFASPFLVADKGTGGDPVYYEFEGLPLTPIRIDAQSDGSLKLDLVNLPAGTYTVKVRAGNLWGVSDYSDPFTFTRPEPVTKPIKLELLP